MSWPEVVALPIRLTITKGLQEGRELVFEQAEVKIGRTSENDLVLHDHGVSRRHARIIERAGLYFAADVGSSNGTSLNGTLLPGEQQLRDGDRITVGPVEFTFVWVPPDGDEDATRPIRRTAALGGPLDGPPDVLPTGKLPAVTPQRPADSPPPAMALEKADARSVPARPAPAPAAEGMTAAERARRRRELAGSGGGQLALWWGELSRGARVVVGLGMALVLAGGLGALGWVFLPEGGKSGRRGPEPLSLGVDPVPDSFGLGEGVQWERPDQKSFEFQFVTPTRAVAVLHYQASGISKEEVALVLNGANLGWVPPDTASAMERELEFILPIISLKRNDLNTVVFDNVRNPPGNESWRVWNLRLEIIPVPELSRDELVTKARQYAVAGARFYETRAIGSENLFKAWQQYRFAWLTLEALDEKPDLYQDVRFQLGQVSAELDHKCSQLMLDFQRSVQFRNAKKARAALQEVSRRFPTAEHRCHNRALELAYEHEL
ncbi:FHA domain-containing protein [Pyxidicoccus caerfyrddinensis]|uniref:FHA domain-containing protein n=1 Tax=Pyxidicoccus caerfyrddinensis TaxID=2709663 RepID=UPI001F0713D2|nr:FHA domain-containing protein [Pyxidicoccus caerfyrddinensis]